MDIWRAFMFDLRYKGLQIEVSLHPSRELLRFNMDLFDVIDILEQGSETKKRKKNIEEKFIIRGKKKINVVIAKCKRFYEMDEEEVWRLIHIGETTK